MTHLTESFYCESCGCPEYSSCGNPLYSFQKSAFNTLLVCKDCLEDLEEEKKIADELENTEVE